MRVDLHLHSFASVSNGDSIKWESTLSTIKTLLVFNVKAFAFTDHNVFDSKLYLESRSIVKNKVFCYPGVEIDVLKDNDVIGHMLIIFEHDLSKEEIIKIENICRFKLRKRGIRIKTLNSLFKEFETVRIPHVGKSDFFTHKELEVVDHDAIEIVSRSHPNYISWVKNKNNRSTVSFSDTHIWNKYPQNKKLITEINYDGNLKDLKEKLKLNKVYSKERR